MYNIRKSLGLIALLIIVSVYFLSCGDDDCPTCPSALDISLSCPPDTVVPINQATPEEIGIYPTVSSSCMSDPTVTWRDSVPPGMTGGLIRIWKVIDTCGNSAICMQTIGLGAPSYLDVECPPSIAIPGGQSTHPDSINSHPLIEATCDSFVVTWRDSVPDDLAGGFIRIWEAVDTCGNNGSCLQSIGIGAP